MRYILVILFLLPSLSYAQGYSFSQFHSSPLSLNPALNGAGATRIRVSSIFRNQWVYGGSPYLTGSLGIESKILANSIPDFHSFGIGVNMIVDQSNSSGLIFNSYNIGSAYHISLDSKASQILGVGIQGSFNQRIINLNNLTFESQFGSGGFNNSLPVGETFQNLSSKYFDANTGLLYQFNSDRVQFGLGGAVYNVTQAKNQSGVLSYRIPRRYVFHSSFVSSDYNGNSILGSLTSISTNGLNNLTAGLAFRKTKDNLSFIGGCWYRIGDAVIPYVGISKNGLNIGVSFDNTISTLKAVAQTRNAFELSFIYTPLNEIKEQKKYVPWY